MELSEQITETKDPNVILLQHKLSKLDDLFKFRIITADDYRERKENLIASFIENSERNGIIDAPQTEIEIPTAKINMKPERVNDMVEDIIPVKSETTETKDDYINKIYNTPIKCKTVQEFQNLLNSVKTKNPTIIVSPPSPSPNTFLNRICEWDDENYGDVENDEDIGEFVHNKNEDNNNYVESNAKINSKNGREVFFSNPFIANENWNENDNKKEKNLILEFYNIHFQISFSFLHLH
jgi:hypothetical protein